MVDERSFRILVEIESWEVANPILFSEELDEHLGLESSEDQNRFISHPGFSTFHARGSLAAQAGSRVSRDIVCSRRSVHPSEGSSSGGDTSGAAKKVAPVIGSSGTSGEAWVVGLIIGPGGTSRPARVAAPTFGCRGTSGPARGAPINGRSLNSNSSKLPSRSPSALLTPPCADSNMPAGAALIPTLSLSPSSSPEPTHPLVVPLLLGPAPTERALEDAGPPPPEGPSSSIGRPLSPAGPPPPAGSFLGLAPADGSSSPVAPLLGPASALADAGLPSSGDPLPPECRPPSLPGSPSSGDPTSDLVTATLDLGDAGSLPAASRSPTSQDRPSAEVFPLGPVQVVLNWVVGSQRNPSLPGASPLASNKFGSFRRSLRLASKQMGIKKNSLQRAQDLMCSKLKSMKASYSSPFPSAAKLDSAAQSDCADPSSPIVADPSPFGPSTVVDTDAMTVQDVALDAPDPPPSVDLVSPTQRNLNYPFSDLEICMVLSSCGIIDGGLGPTSVQPSGEAPRLD